MNLEQWREFNNADLARRLKWLRDRFRALIENSCDDTRSSGTDRETDRGDTDRSEPGTPDTRTAMDLLTARLSLTKFESEILLLCSAMEFDPGTSLRCAAANGELSQPYPTFALAMNLFDDPDWAALSPDRPLRHARLIEINQPGATPLTSAALRADERIVNFLKGLNSLDDRLAPLMIPFDVEHEAPLPLSQAALSEDVASQIEYASQSGGGRLPLVQLVGADTASKQLVAQHLAERFGLQLLRLPVELIPTDFSELETLLRLWDRESRLLPLALYVDAHDSEGLDKHASPASRFFARASGLIILDTNEVRHTVGRPTLVLDVNKPTSDEQRALWQLLLDNDQAASQLAGQFSLNSAMIQTIADQCRVGIQSTPVDEEVAAVPVNSSTIHKRVDPSCGVGSLTDRVWNACRRATRPRLEALAQRIDTKATWNDLVLPADEASQLKEIASQIRHRGRVYDDWGFRAKHNRGLGVSVLFAGESGTGKTMAAEVIANDLQLDLYRIDLSAVVNKYIGETEKNLRKLFDAADDSGAILFFDEADSLFGKRTEVKDSHDRYANLEVNYLLQRMEAYRGLAILATNLKSSIDTAFLRRLRFVINFPVPDAAQRRELWRKAFPREMPIAPLDLERLARLNITGGNIHTIALNAAFASASESVYGVTSKTASLNSITESPPKGQWTGGLSMPQILKAARTEFRKLQKPINAADFRPSELEETAR